MTIDGMIATLSTIDEDLRKEEISVLKQGSDGRILDVIDPNLVFDILLKTNDVISIH